MSLSRTLNIYAITSIMLFSCQSNVQLSIDKNDNLTNIDPSTPLEQLVIEVNTELIKKLLRANEAMVIYFGNPYCSSCQALKPNLEQYLIEYQPLMYHFDNLINENLVAYDSLVSDFPQLFSSQIQTPSFYFIERQQTLLHYQSPTQEFMDYRSFSALMNYRLKVNDRIMFNQFPHQGWMIVKAYETSEQVKANMDFVYDYFSSSDVTLSWMNHEEWAQTQLLTLDSERTYLLNIMDETIEYYDLNNYSLEMFSQIITG